MYDPKSGSLHSFIIHKHDNSTDNHSTVATRAWRGAPKEGKSPRTGPRLREKLWTILWAMSGQKKALLRRFFVAEDADS
jgi:hypothetical protein